MTSVPGVVIARTAARVGACVLILCVALLTFDYVSARLQEPGDKAGITRLQKKVQVDASFAPALAKEHDRITKVRRARKSRDDVAAIILIAGAGLFLSGSKWLVARRGRSARIPAGLVQIREVGPPARSPSGGQPSAPRTTAPEVDLAAVDEMIARYGRGKDSAIPLLQAIQSHFSYLPDEALEHVCRETEITPAQISGTSSFYAQFRRSPLGKHLVRVCHGTACHVSGAKQITEELHRHLGIPPGQDTDPERRFTIDKVACLGCCSLAPVVMVDEHTAGKLTPRSAVEAVDAVEPREFA